MNNFTTTKKRILIKDIVPNPWNPNRQTSSMKQKGVSSVKEFGMLGSILCREVAGIYEILDGEHRLGYAKELGYTELDVESLGEIDDSRAKILTVLLNNLRGKDDIEKRAAIYKKLDEGQLQLLPFTADEIKNEKDLFEFDFSQYESKDIGIPSNEMIKVLSFKFSGSEWSVVNEALQFAKSQGQTEKQWFMLVLKEYLRKNGIKIGFN